MPPEDLAPYSPQTLADLAAEAFEHLKAPRTPDGADIRLFDFEIEREGRRQDVTVLEIVNDNMPFLLDSTLAEIVDEGYEPLLVAHPILAVERDASGALVRLVGEATAALRLGVKRESFIHIHLPRIDDPETRTRLIDTMRLVHNDVAVAVHDWPGMRARVAEIVHNYRLNPPPLPEDEVKEAIAFLDWISRDNFTFLGLREYRLPSGDTAADPVEGSGLGLLRDPSVRVLRRGRELVAMTPEIRAFLERPQALIITKANVKSRVHRRAHLDYIGVKLFDENGRLRGELRIVGLFTASAYTNTTAEVPYLRLKVAKLIARAGFDPSSYASRALLNVLENYPRDELFQIDEDTLYHFAIDIMNLSERPRVRALARVDEFDRFVSVLVFVPKDRYDTQAPPAHRPVPRLDLRGPHVRLLSGLSGRAARAHALHHRPRRGSDAAGGARDPGEGHFRHRPHLERRPARCARRDRRRRSGRVRSPPAMPKPSAPPIARLSAPSRPSPTSRFWSSSRRRGRAPSISTAARATTKHAST